MQVLRVIHKTATLLVLAVGVLHTLATFYFFEELTEEAVWFAGAGLGGIFVAFLNLGLWHGSPEVRKRWLIDSANVLFMLWLVAGAVATPQPPSFVVVLVGGSMALSGLLLPRRESTR